MDPSDYEAEHAAGRLQEVNWIYQLKVSCPFDLMPFI
jgi:hypothetical protein